MPAPIRRLRTVTVRPPTRPRGRTVAPSLPRAGPVPRRLGPGAARRAASHRRRFSAMLSISHWRLGWYDAVARRGGDGPWDACRHPHTACPPLLGMRVMCFFATKSMNAGAPPAGDGNWGMGDSWGKIGVGWGRRVGSAGNESPLRSRVGGALIVGVIRCVCVVSALVDGQGRGKAAIHAPPGI